jgi:hypothetical protein
VRVLDLAAGSGGWLQNAGFRDARTLAVPGPSPLILATKSIAGLA